MTPMPDESSHLILPDGDPVLTSRFAVPVLPPTFVHRGRLTQHLQQGLRDGPLVLVNGPAGAGKTFLVADWFTSARPRGSAAWLTLESSDDASGLFWAYTLEALRYHGVELSEHIGSPGLPARVDPSLLARLADELNRREEPVTLVLDEFDRITSPAVAEELHELVRHASPRLRLVLVSRSDPLLPLHRYAAAGQLTEVRAAELAFKVHETSTLLSLHGLPSSDGVVRALNERTHGWAAGLRLWALAALRAPDPESYLKEFEESDNTIADFLTVEVLERQRQETQDLLLRTSLLERIHPDLADALTGRKDAGRLLVDLHRVNAFVTPVGHSWYRQHPLFAEILRARLRARYPGLEAELHSRAAHWLGSTGLVMDALPHAVAAGDWGFAATLLVDDLAIGSLLTGRDTDRLTDLFSRMPPGADGAAPELIRAALALARHDTQRGVTHLRQAESEVRAAGGPAARLSLTYLNVLAGRLLADADRAETAAREADQVRDEDAYLLKGLESAHPEFGALLLSDLGAVLLWAGRLDEAREALQAAAEVESSPSTAGPRHESLNRLALIELLSGRLRRAEQQVGAADSEAERSGLPKTEGTGTGQLALAEVALERDDLSAARRALERAAALEAAQDDPVVSGGLAVLRSRLCLARGDVRGALEALRGVRKAAEAAGGTPAPEWLSDRAVAAAAAARLAAGDPAAAVAAVQEQDAAGPEALVAEAQAQLACGDCESALRALDRLPASAARGPAVAVAVLLARAQAATALGDDAAARRLLVRALTVAAPERQRRPFREAAPWLRRMLRSEPSLAASHDWLPAELRPAPAPGQGPAGEVPPGPVESLSSRECDVLARAAQLMSTEEIAADLFLSVNTVKTHLKNINRKLSVTRRTEAVRRARELGLL
ncbi:LuxR C-terminal-related transcriptional regulator [Streptacidiphilus jiangxiensis]|uniref:LuxR family transcriptional regulator, maltose regulon positive regulatory protein n=1 Tax=Streptacidiphilus jiangxiensis TaxID=235985 RepID=A0A1H7T9C9_STRJI|nr:LuxR C-terminal-related transcriptional regulator [Streptacidiphilus jiangxiensis]SEL81135.1 LuxR family transcriptional regulator, maltose regulon positive regulatory protein [Streptacidiphilus jiangxiensis]